MELRRVCVFCGSRTGDDPAYADAKAIRLESTTAITSFLIEGRD